MQISEAQAKSAEIGLEPGSFIRVDISAEVEKVGRSGAMRLRDTGFKSESMVSSRHVADGDLKIRKDRDEFTGTLHGYFEEWLGGSTGVALRISGNGVVSRISVHHITDFRMLSPTLGA